MRRILVIAVALWAGCAGKPTKPTETAPKTGDARPAAANDGAKAASGTHRAFAPALKTHADFMALSNEVAGERYTKFVIDVRSGKITYFDVNVYPLHKQFVFAQIYKERATPERLRQFALNYGKHKPEFILGAIVHHTVPDVWTVSLSTGDQAPAADVARMFGIVSKTFVHAGKLKFRPDATAQEAMAKTLPDNVPVVTNDKLYKQSEYAAFNTGRAVGTLRIVAAPAGDDTSKLNFGRDEIVILPEVVTDITPVRGIVSETFSTPLAHVNLRAIAWGIPNIGLKGAAARYKALDGKQVVLEATHKGHTLREATKEEMRRALVERMKERVVVTPHADLTVRELRPLDQISYRDGRIYGAKTANLGSVAAAKLPGVTVPSGFGIPIAFHAAHMKRHKLDKRVRKLLANQTFARDADYRRAQLAKLRQAIREAPLDKALLDEVMKRVEAMAGGKGVFVRSSTNAEDLPGFNGAGLYDTVPNVTGREAMSQAIRQVWASIWNLRAYEERDYFGMPHDKVYGAILVQNAVNATAAGVLVTQHPNNPAQKTTYTINAKSGLGLRVVGGKKIPEVVLFDYSTGGLRVLSRSDETTKLVTDPKGGVKEVPIDNPGTPVLSDALARQLGQSARRIEVLFGKLLGKPMPLDMEWLFAGDTLNIVQVRPYVAPRARRNR